MHPRIMRHNFEFRIPGGKEVDNVSMTFFWSEPTSKFTNLDVVFNRVVVSWSIAKHSIKFLTPLVRPN